MYDIKGQCGQLRSECSSTIQATPSKQTGQEVTALGLPVLTSELTALSRSVRGVKESVFLST